MSSSISRRYLGLMRGLVHPLLAIFLPLLFLLSADQLLRTLFSGVFWFPRVLTPLLLVAGIEEAVMGNLLFKERASFLARLRELVVVLALAFGVLFVLLVLRSGSGLRLSPALIYPLTATLLQWLFSHGIHSGLRERELLLSALKEKRGAALRHTLRDSSYQAGLTIRVLRNIRAGIIAFQCLVVALLIAAAVLKRQPGLGAAVVIAFHTIGGLMGIGILHGFEEQQLLLGSGNPLPLALERRRIVFCLSLLALSAAVVALAARNASLLPLSALIALLRKLASLFRLPENPGLTEALQNALIERQRFYQAMRLSRPAPPVVSPFALFIVEVTRRLFRTILGAGLFLFLVSPLLSQDFLDRLRELHPFRALRTRIAILLGYTIRLWLRTLRWLRSAGRKPALTVEEEQGAAGRFDGRKTKIRRLTVRKRLQMSRVQRAFLTLTRWGEQLGVPYLFYLTPLEYSQHLCEAVPSGSGQLVFIVDVFEEVMYSNHLVAAGRIALYLRTIRAWSRLNPQRAAEAGTSSRRTPRPGYP